MAHVRQDVTPDPPYDLLGDVHGNIRTFEAIIDELGYRKQDGRWTHPDGRTLISVGDLLDRGPDPLGCLELMAEMVSDGLARMVLGNHEINAMHYMEGLREHSERHFEQFEMTLVQIQIDEKRWDDARAFLETCPTKLVLDDGKLRVIHACWSEPHVDRLPEHINSPELWARTAKGGDLEDVIENCIKGPEEPCTPRPDKYGHIRDKKRILWWEDYPADAPFIAFGHYWLPPEDAEAPSKPELLGPGRNAACLDYSAGNGGPIVTLRYPELEFVTVECRDWSSLRRRESTSTKDRDESGSRFVSDGDIVLKGSPPPPPEPNTTCSCCMEDFEPETLTNEICERCAKHVRCIWCGEQFRPGGESTGKACQSCASTERAARNQPASLVETLMGWHTYWICPYSKCGKGYISEYEERRYRWKLLPEVDE